MNAKITAYNLDLASGGCDDFSLNIYWGKGYKNVFYLDGSQGRPTFENIIETKTDITGKTTRTQNTSIEKHIVSIVACSPLLQFLQTIDKCDVKEIEYLDGGETFTITNIDIDDQGDTLNPVQLVYITFEDNPISKVSSVDYVDDEAKLAFWDNNNDGSKDLNGEAEYDALNDYFNSWQLYYEADGITPATSGNITLLAYAVGQTGAESLIGIFTGDFGAFFSDSDKWQSTQNIWDYFNLADTVGHTNRVQFDKKAFAEDNGYYSDEQEDRAVSIRFELGIDSSERENTTLSLVYTVWGAFNIMKIQDPTTKEYGAYTIGKVDQKNTLNNFQDIRTPLPSGANVLVTLSTLTNTTPFYNQYLYDLSTNNENYYDGSFVSKGGYTGSCSRGSLGSCNFTFGMDQRFPVNQNLNILNYTIGSNPKDVLLYWLWERDITCGAYANLQDINAAGDAKLYLNGVLVTSFLTVAPATSLAQGSQSVILPNTQVNTITFEAELTSGFIMKTEFEVQLKALF